MLVQILDIHVHVQIFIEVYANEMTVFYDKMMLNLWNTIKLWYDIVSKWIKSCMNNVY